MTLCTSTIATVSSAATRFTDQKAIDSQVQALFRCLSQDDMWFSAHLAQKGIRRLVLGAALGVQESWFP